MPKQITVCPVADLPPGAVTGAGPYAIGNIDGKYFAVTRRCRHLRAAWRADRSRTGDWSARGTSRLHVENGQMVRGPNRSSRRSPDSERRSRCCRKFGLLDAALSVSGNDIIVDTGACAIRLSIWERSDWFNPSIAHPYNRSSESVFRLQSAFGAQFDNPAPHPHPALHGI